MVLFLPCFSAAKTMFLLADKMLICSAFIAFIELEWMPAWMVIVIVARE